MKLKNFSGLGMNINSDKFLLPDHYTSVTTEPFYSGDGIKIFDRIKNPF